jgi:hypothetical protein
VAGSKSPPARRRRTPTVVDGFYDAALSEAEREALPLARRLGGIDEEIAVLRLRLRSVLTDHPENLSLMVRGIDLLAKALSTRYRLTKEERADVTDNLRHTLKGFDQSVCLEVNQ